MLFEEGVVGVGVGVVGVEGFEGVVGMGSLSVSFAEGVTGIVVVVLLEEVPLFAVELEVMLA